MVENRGAGAPGHEEPGSSAGASRAEGRLGARPGRRRLLVGAGAAAALTAGGCAAWWTIARRSPNGGDGSRTPEPCLEPRELPSILPDELAVSSSLDLASEDLGIVFRSVSVQDVAFIAPAGAPPRLLVTQHGARAQIQFLALDGSADPVVFDAEFGVNPGVAVTEEGTSYFVTREKGHLLAVDPGLSQLRDLGRVSENATSLYSPVIGPGGSVFGGSYPTGAVWRADPDSGAITIGPRIGKNLYVRSLAVIGDRIFAGTGGDTPALVEIDPASLGPILQLDVPGVRSGGTVSRLVPLADGRMLVYRDEQDGGSDGILLDPSNGVFGEELSPGASSRSLVRDPLGDGMIYVADGTVMRWRSAERPVEAGPSPMENPSAMIALDDGSVLAVAADPEGREKLQVAPVSPPGEPWAVPIVASGHDITAVIPMPTSGQLAIGGYQGDGLVVLDPADRSSAHTRRGTGIQQVEGGVESGPGAVLVGSYGEGRVHEVQRQDGTEVLAVDQIDDLGAELRQARPIAWAQVDDGFAVGTVPEQGRAGGMVQMFRRTDERLRPAESVVDPAGGLSIVGIVECAHGELVVTTSVRGGYGTLSDESESRVMRLAVADGSVLWETIIPVPDAYSPIIQQGRIFCATTSGLLVLDLDSGELLARLEVGEPAASPGYTSARLEPWQSEGRFLHAARGRLRVVDVVDGTVAEGSDGVGSPLAVLGSSIYAASGPALMRFALPAAEETGVCAGDDGRG